MCLSGFRLPDLTHAKLESMTEVLRFDVSGRLGQVKRTPQGGIEVPATLTRAGILEYKNPDGSIRREYRPPDEVFRPEAVASLKHATVTNLHPKDPRSEGLIDAQNFRTYAVGHLSGEPRQDGETLAGDLVIQDKRTISQIEAKERNEVSCGYTCHYDPTPGRSPTGEYYHGVQRNIIYNHVALVPRGRAGRDVALRLDSAGNQMSPGGAEDTMDKIEIIDGTEYSVGTPGHTKAKADYAQKRADAEDMLSTAKAERDQYKTELDKIKADKAEEGKRFDAAVEERVTVIGLARAKGVDTATAEGKSLSNEEIRAAVLTKVSPSLKFDSADDTYVKVALDLALSSGNLTDAANRAINPVRTDEDEDEELAPDVLARENMVRRLDSRPEIDSRGKPVARN